MYILFGIFIILHGLVHLLYFGHTNQYFELKPGMTWPVESWIFSGMVGDHIARFVASLLLVLASLGFVAGGVGILFNLAWRRDLIIAIALLSSLIFIIFWNGSRQNLDGQGIVGILINLWLLVMVLLVRWPQVNL